MMGLVAVWKLGVENYLYKKYPSLDPARQAQVESTTEPSNPEASGAAAQSPAVAGTTGPTTSAVASVNPASSQGLRAVGSEAIQPANLGSDQYADPTYAMALSVDPAGAGLSSVSLNNFFEAVESKSLYVFQQPLASLESTTHPLATQSITVNGHTLDLSKINWTRKSADASSATYVADVVGGDGQPVLELDKTFQVFPRDTKDGSKGYEIHLLQNFKNLSGKPISVKAVLDGPNLPKQENERSIRQFLAGYDNGYDEVYVGDTAVTSFKKSSPTKDLVTADKRKLLWVGAGSGYFNAIVRPEDAGAHAASPIQIAAVPTTGINLDAPTADHDGTMKIETNDFTLDPHASAPFNLRIFFGPKQRALLNSPYYSAFPLCYNNTLVTSEGYCGFLTFNWLVTVLYYILAAFHFVFRDWGLAIIGLVCLVRLVLHPITKKSQVNMMAMGKMGPEIERLKKKYGDNKDELNKAMMQVYKQQGATPILGCLPMFLQMPIWIALWSALQSTFDLRQAGFLHFGSLHLTWIDDLSRPDAVFTFSHPVPLLFFTITSVNLLPVLMAIVSYIQTKLQPTPTSQTPEQEKQKKMMQWMVLLFPIMLYTAPSGLNLYIITSSAVGIWENKIIRKHIQEKEEAEKAGRIIVDAKPTRAGKRREKEAPKPVKKGGVMGWIAELQAKAEEVRREAERRGKDRA